MRLKDKVAIVTGGGTGIGKVISLAFAREGAAVVVAARTLPRLEAVAEEIRSKGGRATTIQTDITDEKQVQRMVAQTLKEYGQIDILVNDAAIVEGTMANVVDVKLDDWNDSLATTLTGAFLCTREVLKSMIPRRSGNIISIVGEEAGRAGLPMFSPYGVSKAGLQSLGQGLAVEVGRYNIRVNWVSPYWVEGGSFEKMAKRTAEAWGRPYEEVYKEVMNEIAAKTALGRIVTPDEVANAAVFLASDESSGITGQSIIVDAGSRLQLPM